MVLRFWSALMLALLAALPSVPAFAQSPTGDKVCGGGTTSVEPGESVRSLVIFGCSGVVRSGGTVEQDAVVFGGSLRIEKGAKINHSVAILGGSANIDGEIANDLSIAGGSATLGETSVVHGNVRIAGGSVNRSSGSTVGGSISQENSPRIILPPFAPLTPFGGPGRFFGGGFDFLHSVFGALAMAALGALLVVFFPTPVQRVAATAQNSFVPSVGVGCLTLLIAPVLAIALAITIIGIPIVLLLALAGAAAWYFGWLTVGYLAGERILKALNVREIAPIAAVVAGVLVIAIVGALPCLGGLISGAVGVLGLGAVILTRFGTQSYPYPPAPTAPAAAVVPSAPMNAVSAPGTEAGPREGV
jgi:hypothetical protein